MVLVPHCELQSPTLMLGECQFEEHPGEPLTARSEFELCCRLL